MKNSILKNRLYLYLTEFFAGMSVMAVELGASRLLAPYFSSSQIVWTIIIGTIMIAMALGNLYGGKAADKDPNPDKLYGRIIIAALWIAAIPVVGKYIIGTFVPTFISIPAVGTSITFLIFAGILLLLAVIYFVSTRGNFTGARRVPISIVIFLICCLLGHNNSFAFWQSNLTYEGESIYNYLQVYENDREVVLSTNVLFGVQSVYLKDKGLTGMYYDYAMAAPYMAGVKEKDRLDILILGNGTGTYATQCERYFNNTSIKGVEIDEKITKLARKYFELPEDVEVTTYDGRAYLNVISEKYDVIMVDAYQDITIPFQMSTVEFFTMVKEHLKDDGVMVVNMNMHSGAEGNINEYLADTISEVFDQVCTVDVSGSTNRELFASDNADMLQTYRLNVALEQDGDLTAMMGRIGDHLETYEAGGHIMTDDKAPVELLGMRMIDELIQNEVSYYKTIYQEKGIRGLIDLLS